MKAQTHSEATVEGFPPPITKVTRHNPFNAAADPSATRAGDTQTSHVFY